MKPQSDTADPTSLALDRAGRADFPHLFGVHDLSRLNTTPGAASPFAPRADWAPSAEEYVEALRAYCRSPCGPRQMLMVLARRMVVQGGEMPEAIGPYAPQITGILSAFVAAHHRVTQAGDSPSKRESWRSPTKARRAHAQGPPSTGRLEGV